MTMPASDGDSDTRFVDPYTQVPTPLSRIEAANVHTPQERHELIARAAYYRAQRRRFEPGHELEDWLAAEEEVNAACGLIEPSPRWDV